MHPSRAVTAAAVALSLVACQSEPQRPTGPSLSPSLRRLSLGELNSVATQLLGEDRHFDEQMLREPGGEGFDNDSESLGVESSRLDDFVDFAEQVSRELTSPSRIEVQFPCEGPRHHARCASQQLSAFAFRAWGRPLEGDEPARLFEVYETGALGRSHAHGMELALQAILLSPHFLYRTELEPTLNAWETASAISFFVTGQRPDAALLSAAATGQLFSADGREAQARRLLATSAARKNTRRFFRLWLKLSHLERQTKADPAYTPAMQRAVGEELDRWIDSHALDQPTTVAGYFASTRAFPSQLTLPLYAGTLASEEESDPALRRGLLTTPAFLIGHSSRDASGPIDRGLFVRSRVFCQEIAPPPPTALANPPDLTNPRFTTRQKYADHSNKPQCQGCHRMMDPIGFGLEDFDFLGRHRTTENAQPVDAAGALEETDVDGTFIGGAQLGEKLSKSKDVERCFERMLWRFAAGHTVPLDVARPGASLDYPALVLEVVRQDAFVRRAAP